MDRAAAVAARAAEDLEVVIALKVLRCYLDELIRRVVDGREARR